MRVLGREGEQDSRGPWFLNAGWAAGLSLLAWVLANLLDVFSVLAMVQDGARMVWARHHPAEAFVIYGLFRLLIALAVPLGAASASRRWPWVARTAWGMLTLGALVTAAGAWWRLYR
jgi:hypothetical protein